MATTEERAGLIVADGLPRYEEMPGHHGPAPIYVGPEILPGVPFRVAAADAAELVDKPIADLHRHDAAEIYVVVTAGLKFEVQTEHGNVPLESPVSVLIPAGVRHRFVVREAAVAPLPFLGILVDLER